VFSFRSDVTVTAKLAAIPDGSAREVDIRIAQFITDAKRALLPPPFERLLQSRVGGIAWTPIPAPPLIDDSRGGFQQVASQVRSYFERDFTFTLQLSEAAPSLLTNGDFETGAVPGQAAPYWLPGPGPRTFPLLVANDQVHSGSFSGKIENVTVGDSRWQQAAPVVLGGTYELQAWVRFAPGATGTRLGVGIPTPPASQGGALVSVLETEGNILVDGGYTAIRVTAVTNTWQWGRIRFLVTDVTNGSFIRVVAFVGIATQIIGTLWLDDITFVRVDPFDQKARMKQFLNDIHARLGPDEVIRQTRVNAFPA